MGRRNEARKAKLKEISVSRFAYQTRISVRMGKSLINELFIYDNKPPKVINHSAL